MAISHEAEEQPSIVRIVRIFFGSMKRKTGYGFWGQPGKIFAVPIEIKAYDRQGLVTDISKVVSEEGVNLIDMSMKMSQHLVVIKLVIGVQGITQLSRILTKLENLPNVYEAKRRGPG